MLASKRRSRDNRFVVHTLAAGERGGPAVIGREALDSSVTDVIRVCAGGVGGYHAPMGSTNHPRTPRAAPTRIRRPGGTTRPLCATRDRSSANTSATQSPRRHGGFIDMSSLVLRLAGSNAIVCDTSSDDDDDESSSCDSDGTSTVSDDTDGLSLMSTTSSAGTSPPHQRKKPSNAQQEPKSASKKSKRQRGCQAGKKRLSRLPSARASPARSDASICNDREDGEVIAGASSCSDGSRVCDGLRLLPPPRTEPRLTVVLDLDETLVRLREGPVFVRPHAKLLFETLKAIEGIEVIIWTCATEKYARYALSCIPSATFHHIISRDARWYAGEGQPAVKNLRWLGRDLSRCVQVDNCPVAVSANPDHCILVQDIPECLPMNDSTLTHVAHAIAHILGANEPVDDALASCDLIDEVIVTVEDIPGSDEDFATPATSPTTGGTAGNTEAFPDTGLPPEAKGTSMPQCNVTFGLAYNIPGVVPTYGAREQPTKRECHLATAKQAAQHRQD